MIWVVVGSNLDGVVAPKAAEEFKDKTTATIQLWHIDFTYSR